MLNTTFLCEIFTFDATLHFLCNWKINWFHIYPHLFTNLPHYLTVLRSHLGRIIGNLLYISTLYCTYMFTWKWLSSLLTVFCVSGTRACHILVMEFWIFGVGSNWYRYNRGIIVGRCWDSCSPADAAIVEKPNAAPYTDNTSSVSHHYNVLQDTVKVRYYEYSLQWDICYYRSFKMHHEYTCLIPSNVIQKQREPVKKFIHYYEQFGSFNSRWCSCTIPIYVSVSLCQGCVATDSG
jgi:hypothetical protein